MNKKAEIILRKYKGKQVGVFIDDANMFHTQREAEWLIDWRKFKQILDGNFKVKFIKYYRGVYPRGAKTLKKIKEKHQRYGRLLKRIGFEVIHRDLKKIYLNKKKKKFIYKCDFDGEMGFDIAAALKEIDLVVLVSGDSDFAFLTKKLQEFNKAFLVICFEFKAPWEFYRLTHIFFEEIEEVRLIKNTPRRGVNITV